MGRGVARRRGGGRLGDRAAGARRPQGVLAGVPEGVSPLALFHHISKHQRVGAVAVAVAGNAPRVEQHLERPRCQYGGIKLDMHVDFSARPVRAVGGSGGGDVDHGRRRQPDQIDAGAVGDYGVRYAAQAERSDGARAGGPERDLPIEGRGGQRCPGDSLSNPHQRPVAPHID